MPNHLAPCLLFALASPWLVAQGALPLSGTWRFFMIENETFSSACSPPAPLHIDFEYGTISFRPDGTGSGSDTQVDICPGGACSSTQDAGSGRYSVTSDGLVLFHEGAGASGLDAHLEFLRSDASLILDGCYAWQDEPQLGLTVALSSGHSAASLSGTYGLVRFVMRFDAVAQTLRTDYGTLSFDGAGGFAESTDRHEVTWNDVITTPPTPSTPAIVFSGGGTYAVAPDGTVTIGGGGLGAVTADREFVCWTRYACPEVEITLAVRLPVAGAPSFVAGDWRLCGTEIDVAMNRLRSDWGTISLTSTGAGGGTLTPDLFRISTVSTSSGTTTTNPSAANDTFTLGAQGAITLFSGGSQRRPVRGWVSRDGSVLIGAPSMPTGSALSPGVGLMIGLTRCAMPARVGAATPGTGGVSPELFSLGGFPYPGNSDFGFVGAAGLGGAPGALLLAGDVLPAAMPVLGFHLWIDPAQLAVSAPVVLSGPVGVPGVGAFGVPLPLPSTPALGGAILGAQVLVLDSGAPQGLAASGALRVRVSR